jgi:NAD(P)-dependent dehydrogenase (short-subunit alcohol dehydrogenase family)
MPSNPHRLDSLKNASAAPGNAELADREAPPIQQLVVITGASGGIGSAVVRSVSEHSGTDVITIGVDVADSEGVTVSINGDVTSPDTWKIVIEAVKQWNAPLVGLVCVAGVASECSLRDLELAEFRRVVDASLTGTYLALHSLYDFLVAGHASVVTLSSGYARRGNPSGAHYAAAKCAVEGLTRSAALELAPHGVRVNAVAPGPVVTAMTSSFGESRLAALARVIPQGRLGEPGEIADVISFLLGPASAHITGQVIQVNGGLYLG